MFNRIRLTISYLTNSPILPGTIKDLKNKIKIRVESKGQLQIVTFFERPSSIPSYENYPNQNSFIREFLIYYLNSLNSFIEIYKYQYANPLVNTISIFGILKIEAIIGKNRFIINEPFALKGLNKSPIIKDSYIFLNDFLDAIGDLISYRMNDSIRKLITSLESYLEYKSIKGNINCPFKKNSRNPPNFMSKVFELCNTPNEFMCPPNLYSEILKILYILYKLRNKIIHEGVHLDFFDYVIAHKAIIAYYHMFNAPNNCGEIRNYALNIYIQYLQITGLIAPSRLLNNTDIVISQSDYEYFKNTYEILAMPSK